MDKETTQSGDVSRLEVTQIAQVVGLNQAEYLNVINNLAGKQIDMSGSALGPLRSALAPQLFSHKSKYQISRCKYSSSHTQILASPCQICINMSVHLFSVCSYLLKSDEASYLIKFHL